MSGQDGCCGPECGCGEQAQQTPAPSAASQQQTCQQAMDSAQAFLHGELPEASADEIRQHLMGCEACMDQFEVEQVISSLVRRCCPPVQASPSLRLRVTRLTISYRSQ